VAGVLYLREDEIGELLTVRDAITALEQAFGHVARGEAHVQSRQRVRVPDGLLHVMPAGINGGTSLGLKVYTTFAGIGARFFVLLFDARGGELCALMQADRLGQIRTGAASGLATKYMARPDSATLGLIGAGWQARTQLEAICAVAPIKTARVYSRDARRREHFCATMASVVAAALVPVASAHEAVVGADVVATITSSSEPVFDGEWLAPGTHVNAAGSNHAAKREIDGVTVSRAARIVTDFRAQAQIECGDLIPEVQSGRLRWEDVVELADVVGGREPGRQERVDVTLFESQGIALEDVAVASLVYDRAVERRVGSQLAL